MEPSLRQPIGPRTLSPVLRSRAFPTFKGQLRYTCVTSVNDSPSWLLERPSVRRHLGNYGCILGIFCDPRLRESRGATGVWGSLMPTEETKRDPLGDISASSRSLKTDPLLQAILSASGDPLALLTGEGVIDTVSGQWDQLPYLPPLSKAIESGVNYLEICREEAEAGNQEAEEALEGIRSVLEGTQTSFQRDLEPCDSEDQRWFRMQVVACPKIGAALLRFIDVSIEKLAEREVLERLRFEQGLAEISARLSKLSPAALDSQIEALLKEMVELLGYDRSTLIQQTDTGLLTTHSYARPGIHTLPPGIGSDAFPWYNEQILQNKVIVIPRIPDDFPAEAKKDLKGVLRDGLKSNAVIPLWAEGQVVGAIAFGSLTHFIEWPEEQILRLRLLGEILAGALARRQKHLELSDAFERISDLTSRLKAENIYLRREVELRHSHDEIIGKSSAIRSALKQVEQVAETDTTVLLLGETGTGKELFARAIHNLSPRRGKTMVRVNCAALPSELVESELFGREKGAYTGALTKTIGRFELADEGTIFLDEIGELPLQLQVKLLRVLESGEFERLGSPKTIRVNARIIAATNRNLHEAIKNREFREDLYYRLSVFPISIPALRERYEDVPLLVRAFVQDFNESMGKSVETISRDDLERLADYSWPGNVRELRNLIERAMILARGDKLRISVQPPASGTGPSPTSMTLKDVERTHLLKVLELTRWRVRGKGGAAQVLEMKPSTLEYRMKKLGIQRPQ